MSKAQSISFLLSQVRASGVALAGGEVEFFAAGTSTPKLIWLDRNKAVEAANPYTLDANGTAHLFGDGIYRVVIRDSTGAEKYDRDGISIRDASSNVYNVGDYASLAAAIASIGTTPATLQCAVDQTVSANLTIPATLELMPLNGAVIIVNSGVILTINSAADNVAITGAGNVVFNGSANYTSATIANSGTITFNSLVQIGAYFVFTGNGTVAGSGLQEVTPDWWGATGNSSSPYDTAAVAAAFNSGANVKFTRSYVVDNVDISGVDGQTIDFNGFWLTGGSNYGAAYVLAITGRYLTLHNVKVNQNFKNYTQAIRWYSADAARPSIYNKVYGMHIANATYGLVYGTTPGTAHTSFTHSENMILGLTVRSVQFPYGGNSGVNGYLTLISPILDCNPYEWSAQPGYDATAWQTAAMALVNLTGNLAISGGEILKTTSQLGYGMKGKNVVLSGTTLEISSSQAYLTGDFTIRDTFNGYQSADTVPAFVIDAAADGVVAGFGGKLLLDNCKLYRGAGVTGYSGAKFISGNSAAYTVELRNTELWEWLPSNFIDSGTTTVKVVTHNLRFPTALITNPASVNFGVSVASAATITASDPIFHVTGTTAINIILPPFPQFSGSITIIPDGIFTTTAIGNIALASTAVVKKALIMTYDPTTSLWYPSY